MKVLEVGSGGREHALVWALSKSPKVKEIYCYPGNAGIAQCAQIPPLPSASVADLAQWAQEEQIHLTVVGPEAYLAQGIVDEFAKRGLRVFGPTRQATAQVESARSSLKS